MSLHVFMENEIPRFGVWGTVTKGSIVCDGDSHGQPLFCKWDDSLMFPEWGARCFSLGFLLLFMSYLTTLLWPFLCSRWC